MKLLQQRTLLVDQGIDPANKFLAAWTIRDQLIERFILPTNLPLDSRAS